MTAALIAPDSLSEFEFAIECDFQHCPSAATAMVRGCADPRHYSVCTDHLAYTELWFYSHPENTSCTICHRPFLHFDTHYDIAKL